MEDSHINKLSSYALEQMDSVKQIFDKLGGQEYHDLYKLIDENKITDLLSMRKDIISILNSNFEHVRSLFPRYANAEYGISELNDVYPVISSVDRRLSELNNLYNGDRFNVEIDRIFFKSVLEIRDYYIYMLSFIEYRVVMEEVFTYLLNNINELKESYFAIDKERYEWLERFSTNFFNGIPGLVYLNDGSISDEGFFTSVNTMNFDATQSLNNYFQLSYEFKMFASGIKDLYSRSINKGGLIFSLEREINTSIDLLSSLFYYFSSIIINIALYDLLDDIPEQPKESHYKWQPIYEWTPAIVIDWLDRESELAIEFKSLRHAFCYNREDFYKNKMTIDNALNFIDRASNFFMDIYKRFPIYFTIAYTSQLIFKYFAKTIVKTGIVDSNQMNVAKQLFDRVLENVDTLNTYFTKDAFSNLVEMYGGLTLREKGSFINDRER